MIYSAGIKIGIAVFVLTMLVGLISFTLMIYAACHLF